MMRTRRLVVSGKSLARGLSTPAAANPQEPALTRIYGGLKDQDRIFTNLYGEGVSMLHVWHIYIR